MIGAGEVIGVAATTWCSRGHLHVSMRDQRTGKYVDPSRFKQQRPGLPAAWVEECDHYELVFLVSDTLFTTLKKSVKAIRVEPCMFYFYVDNNTINTNDIKNMF